MANEDRASHESLAGKRPSGLRRHTVDGVVGVWNGNTPRRMSLFSLLTIDER